jgi:ubiquinol-cytochrome c reductase cytochrome b subunit
MAQLATLYYFAFFIVIMPVLGLLETPRKLPGSITEAVLARNAGSAAALPDAATAAPDKNA